MKFIYTLSMRVTESKGESFLSSIIHETLLRMLKKSSMLNDRFVLSHFGCIEGLWCLSKPNVDLRHCLIELFRNSVSKKPKVLCKMASLTIEILQSNCWKAFRFDYQVDQGQCPPRILFVERLKLGANFM